MGEDIVPLHLLQNESGLIRTMALYKLGFTVKTIGKAEIDEYFQYTMITQRWLSVCLLGLCVDSLQVRKLLYRVQKYGHETN